MKLDHIYNNIYSEMYKRNRNQIISNGIKADKLLIEKKDNRKGIALFSFASDYQNRNFSKFIEKCRHAINDCVVYYPNPRQKEKIGLLHFTFLQIIGVTEAIPQEYIDKLDDYARIIQGVLSETKPFTINFKGIIAVPTGLVMYGVPTIDINSVRQKIRAKLNKNLMSLDEPYIANTAHSTILRYTSNNQDIERILGFSEEYKTVNLGEIHINKIYLGFGSWKMLSSEVKMLYEFDLLNNLIKRC